MSQCIVVVNSMKHDCTRRSYNIVLMYGFKRTTKPHLTAYFCHIHIAVQSAVLRDRRAEMEAAMRTEEEELARLSEEARSKVYIPIPQTCT
jgi:hypothetical protein